MDARTRRRCAALAVFEPLLGESELMEALWLCEDRMGGESVTDILRYVDLVGEQHGIDTAVRKRLYGALHTALRRSADDLPLDPWPVMAARRAQQQQQQQPAGGAVPVMPAFAVAAAGEVADIPDGLQPHAAMLPAAQPAAFSLGSRWSGPLPAQGWPAPVTPTVTPTVSALAPARAATHTAQPTAGPLLDTGPVSAAPATPTIEAQPVEASAAPVIAGPASRPDARETAPDDDPDVPAVQRVFADIVDALCAEMVQSHAAAHADWVQACGEQLGAPLQDTPGRAALASLALSVDSGQRRRAWRLTRSTADLSALLTGLYVSLCEALGPVAADQVLGRAVRAAEQRPAAREYPPRGLL